VQPVDRNLRLDEAASQGWLGRLDQIRMLRRSPG
jgi:hypothetical protein